MAWQAASRKLADEAAAPAHSHATKTRRVVLGMSPPGSMVLFTPKLWRA